MLKAVKGGSMNQTRISAIGGLVAFFVAFLWLLPSVGVADTEEVECPDDTIQEAVDDAEPGDTILVSGTCNESITIDKDGIKLIANPGAKIIGPAGSGSLIRVRALNVEITGFTTLTGDRAGITVERSGSAVISDNTVKNSGGFGITITGGSSAILENNTVKKNGSHGIRVTDSSFARIEPNNLVMDNGGHGIIVHRSSAARIFGNTITGSLNSTGILVTASGSADINENIITDNVGDGISVSSSSSARLAETRFIATGNTLKRNGRFGVRCRGFSSLEVRVVQVFGMGVDENISGQRALAAPTVT